MADGRRQIKCLNDEIAASIRGSQVIGSVSRAVEELILNSVNGCSKSCVISVGANEIVVSDDGAGIDPEAMRLFIGKEYCSNKNGRNGESLRSIASLCSEMKIESACWHPGNTDSRKRKSSAENGYIVRSEKIFRDGVVVSFSHSEDNSTTSAIIPTLANAGTGKAGTKITIRGLFHRMAVRRKQCAQANQDGTSNSAELNRIRTCVRLLALSYPSVAFEINTNGKVDCTFKSPKWAIDFTGPLASSLQTPTTTSPSLRVESRALVLRLCDVYPDGFSQDDSIELAFEDGTHKSRSTMDSSRTNFRAFGALRISEGDSDNGVVRNRELEIIGD